MNRKGEKKTKSEDDPNTSRGSPTQASPSQPLALQSWRQSGSESQQQSLPSRRPRGRGRGLVRAGDADTRTPARIGRGFTRPTEGSIVPLARQYEHPAQQQFPSLQPAFQESQSSAQQCPLGSPKATTSDIEQGTEKLSLKQKSDSPTLKKIPTPAVSAKLSNLQLQQIPKRKDPKKAGTLGRPISVQTNMMRINVESIIPNVIHYDVDIVPNTPKYLMRPVFLEVKRILFPKHNPAFDGKKNAFSAGVLPIPSNAATLDVTVYNEDGREKQFSVTIKEVNRIDLSWLKSVRPGLQETERDQISLQALDVILRNTPSLKATSVGRSFFTRPDHVESLGGGMDLWIGLFQSAIVGWKPYLNVDVVHKAFPKPQSVLDLIKTICGCTSEEDQGGRQQYGRQQGYRRQQQEPVDLTPDLIHLRREDIKKFIQGLRLIIELPGQPTTRRTMRVHDLVKCPRENTFDHNGQKITVEQYYKLEKRYIIQFPLFPCLWVGNREKNIHVPLEICTIVEGQVVQKKLDEKQTSLMIKYAATGTDERKKKIMNAFDLMRHNEDPCMNEFGISVSGKFETVPARVLDPPKLKYQNQTARVTKGAWKAKRFEAPSCEIAQHGTWTILNLNRRTKDDELYELARTLKRTGNTVGMLIGDPSTPFEKNIQLRGNDIRKLQSYFNELKSNQIKLVVVIIPDDKMFYSKVKQISELRVGVLTQCLRSKTLFKLNDASTMSNILLKINAKLNGVNHVLDLNPTQCRPKCLGHLCMIVGADVTHPSPDAMNTPSIAAVVSSHDLNAFKYNVEIRLQPARQEIIRDLKEIMIIQLEYFIRATNGKRPEKIIFYRDGVSEGQFGQVMSAELEAIKAACIKKFKSVGNLPKITFLVVQKRHHIRLFPTDKRNSDDRNINVQAGTIVDTHITHPSDIDFYLLSHASIQGTSRPTKYRCLWDDSDMSENEIEELTYFLCHMFSRCTRSVSYPAPTYYAHLAAFRARALTYDVDIDMTNLEQEQLRKLTIKEDILKGNPMFFV